MPDEPRKFAEVIWNPHYDGYVLRVGNVAVRFTQAEYGAGGLKDDAAEINAAFEAEVERRLDEITKRAAV